MMLPEFDATTPLPHGIVRLEASAGTGKTHAITSIVVRTLATTAITADRIVIVTFTRAAAAELRQRVRARITAAVRQLEAPPGPDSAAAACEDEVIRSLLYDDGTLAPQETRTARMQRLRRARERFDDLTIDTIHGFSQRVLQQVGPTLGIDTAVELIENIDPLVDEVVTDLMVRQLRAAPEWWYRMLTDQKVEASRLRTIVLRLEQEPQLVLSPDPGIEPEVVWQHAVDTFVAQWQAQRDRLRAWLTACCNAKAFGATKSHRQDALDVACDTIDAWCVTDRPGLEPIRAAIGKLTRSALTKALNSRANIPDNLTIVDAFTALADAPTQVANAFQAAFVVAASRELQTRKAARAIWSFSDLLGVLDRLVSGAAHASDVVDAIRERTDMALIDEFQDTDPVQWRIFNTIFAERQLVLVGDPKQAIYSFRGADIRTYHDAAASSAHAWSLMVNYRSDQRVLDAIDAVFSDGRYADDGAFAAPEITVAPMRASDAHQSDRLDDPAAPPAGLRLHQVTRELADRDEGPLPRTWANAALPRIVAGEIVEFLARQPRIAHDTGWRHARPGDIAVLTRTNAQAMRVHAALRSCGVPAVVATDRSVFESPEAEDISRLLAALLEPTAERRVRAALPGVILGWTPAAIAAMDDDAWVAVATAIADWSQRWRRQGVAVALRTMMAEVGTLTRAVGQDRGERAITNVLHLIELLHHQEVAQRRQPLGLTQWLDDQRRTNREAADDAELRLDNDTDAVQVLTVHRAKGLQFPVVWNPFLWDAPQQAAGRYAIVRTHDASGSAPILDINLDGGDGTTLRRRRDARLQRWQEDIRVTYVALTRARHRNVVHVGPMSGIAGSGLGRVFFASAPSPDDTATAVEFAPDVATDTDAQLRARLEMFASDAVTIDTAMSHDQRWRDEAAAPAPVAPRTLSRTLDRTWQRTSFSRLVSDPMVATADDDAVTAPATDHDAQPPLTPPTVDAQQAQRDVPLAHVPRGAAIGTVIHRILEDVDFASAERHGSLAAAVAAHAGQFAPDDQRVLIDGLDAAIRTPLGGHIGPVCLGDIARADRLDELEFDMSISGGAGRSRSPATLWQIADVLAACDRESPLPLADVAARLRRRGEQPFRGILTGSIDLVARVDGRYFIADYKSNWLGHRDAEGTERSTLADYAMPRLLDAMVAHDYVLQYHLYAVALHRFLRWRLADYDLERDVAGVAYLFVRGMIGPDQPNGHGVVTDCPPAAVIDALDTVLRGKR